jgi:hypothetical protein
VSCSLETPPRITFITGTGRSGTSLLMALFTKLKLETGFDEGVVNHFVRTGLSCFEVEVHEILQKFKDPNGFAQVKIFKSPALVQPAYLKEFTKSCAEYRNCEVIYLMRNTTESANSRYANFKKGIPEGNLTESTLEEQIRFDTEVLANSLVSFTEYDLPMKIISFPHFADEPEYLFKKLHSFFTHHNITLQEVTTVLHGWVSHHVIPPAKVPPIN